MHILQIGKPRPKEVRNQSQAPLLNMAKWGVAGETTGCLSHSHIYSLFPPNTQNLLFLGGHPRLYFLAFFTINCN